MTEMTGFWLDVDAGARVCVVHAPSCLRAAGAEDRYRGAACCATDGGWLWFATGTEVEAFYRGALAPHGFAAPRDCDRCGGAA